MARIEPVNPPYTADAAVQLEAMMPPGIPPIGLFRTFARNLPMTNALRAWGGYELSADLSLTVRDREIVIDRTCARCGCDYEWGVHIVFFAERAALTAAQIRSLAHTDATDPCWTDERDRVLIAAVDALHDRSDIDDHLWARLAAILDDAQLLDLCLLIGWYHAISYAANAARVTREPGAPRLATA